MTESNGEDGTDHGDEYQIERDEPFDVVNEFAHARICKVYTPKGERLEISSPKRGFKIRLDAVELEAISWQNQETVSKLLEEPLGPED